MIGVAEEGLADEEDDEEDDEEEEEDGKPNDLQRPLAGIPVSLKDSVVVKGFDVSVGYSSTTGKSAAQDGTLVRILRDAG